MPMCISTVDNVFVINSKLILNPSDSSFQNSFNTKAGSTQEWIKTKRKKI